MDNKWMIYYRFIDNEYVPVQFGCNMLPNSNVDKVVHVTEEIAKQAVKFDFDGETLKRKKDKYIMTLEQLKEKERRDEIELWGGVPPHLQEKEEDKIEIEF